MARKADALPLATRRQTTAVLAVSTRTFGELEASGTVRAARPGRGGRPSLYDLTAVVPLYIAHLGQARSPANDREARARRDRAQGELVELTIAERRRQLLPRQQVILEGQAFVKALVAKLRALPRRMAQAGVIAQSAEPSVSALVREALDEISRWSSMLDLVNAQEAS